MITDETKDESVIKEKPSRHFGAILYPNESAEHKFVLEWIFRKYEAIYIEHKGENLRFLNSSVELPKDEISHEGSHKDHVHIVWRIPNLARASSFTKKGKGLFYPYLNHVEAINSPDSYVLYMLHERPIDHWLAEYGRVIYTESDLHTNCHYWQGKIEQNRNFAQKDEYNLFADAMQFIEDNNGASLYTLGKSGEIPFTFLIDNLVKLRYLVQDKRDLEKHIKFMEESKK